MAWRYGDSMMLFGIALMTNGLIETTRLEGFVDSPPLAGVGLLLVFVGFITSSFQHLGAYNRRQSDESQID
jgi:hypothetical protein